LTAFFLFLNVVGIFVFDQSPAAAAQTVPSEETNIPAPAQAPPAKGTEGAGAPVKIQGKIQGVTKDGKPMEINVNGPFKSAGDAAKEAGEKAPPDAAKAVDEANKKPPADTSAPAAGGSEAPASGGSDAGGSKDGGSDKG